MKYTGMPGGMWLLFAGSFKKHLTSVLRNEDGLLVSRKKV